MTQELMEEAGRELASAYAAETGQDARNLDPMTIITIITTVIGIIQGCKKVGPVTAKSVKEQCSNPPLFARASMLAQVRRALHKEDSDLRPREVLNAALKAGASANLQKLQAFIDAPPI